jgi:hypothetical protein
MGEMVGLTLALSVGGLGVVGGEATGISVGVEGGAAIGVVVGVPGVGFSVE